jgi:P27 family predicted phage terminase small subunit
LPAKEPRVEPGKPPCPGWLPAGAKREHRALVRQLSALGVLTRCEPCLPMLALCLHRWREAEEQLELEGLTVVREGVAVRHPAVLIAARYRSESLRLATEYGLSPSSRTRVESLPATKRDELAEFLFGNGGLEEEEAS